jgi:DNA (cytosine-5)-methyltransferase 1
MRQGFDPKQTPQKLQGLDLFCGSGNFGHGLEDGGVVQMRWANDNWDKALHTYMANADSRVVNPFLGSIDDLLRLALEGKFSKSVPAPGEVDFICGGSPCPGFSTLTQDIDSQKHVKDRSLVASFASFVDFYRPKYGILENVAAMIQATGTARTEDLFSQLVCSLLGLGYQIEIVLGNAWEYGAPQSRSRVFLCFAAPGLRLPKRPVPSHSMTARQTIYRSRKLGKLTNNEAWIESHIGAAPFAFVSAEQATADLPDVGDAQADICVGAPDHRLAKGVTPTSRARILAIPTQPYGMSFVRAWAAGGGVMTPSDRAMFPALKPGNRVDTTSKAWTRVTPTELFSTVTTQCSFEDARIGRVLHWKATRPLTVMEARRAQGVPDEEVLLGDPPHQWKMVGNAVPRQVALVLGLAFREAWVGTLYDDPEVRGLMSEEVVEEGEVLDIEQEKFEPDELGAEDVTPLVTMAASTAHLPKTSTQSPEKLRTANPTPSKTTRLPTVSPDALSADELGMNTVDDNAGSGETAESKTPGNFIRDAAESQLIQTQAVTCFTQEDAADSPQSSIDLLVLNRAIDQQGTETPPTTDSEERGQTARRMSITTKRPLSQDLMTNPTSKKPHTNDHGINGGATGSVDWTFLAVEGVDTWIGDA